MERPEASKALNRLGVDAFAVMETGSSAETGCGVVFGNFGLAIFGIRWRKMMDKQIILQACNPNVARQKNTKYKGINQSVQMILPARKVTSTSNKEHVRKKIKGLLLSFLYILKLHQGKRTVTAKDVHI